MKTQPQRSDPTIESVAETLREKARTCLAKYYCEQPPATDKRMSKGRALQHQADRRENVLPPATDDKQWTPEYVMNLRRGYQVSQADKVISGAHNAAVATEWERRKQELRELQVEHELAEGLMRNQLLSAQTAIAEHNKHVEDMHTHSSDDCYEISVDLSALERQLDQAYAKGKIEGWNEGREHERKCAKAIADARTDHASDEILQPE